MKTKVLIYEDNRNLRESLTQLLSRESDIKVLNSYQDCIDVEEHIKKFRPDVVLMDIDLPELNGIEGVKKIRQVDQNTNILMLTVFDDTYLVYDALYAGANGYLLKKYISTRLINSIRDVLEGGTPMSPSIARIIVDNIPKKT